MRVVCSCSSNTTCVHAVRTQPFDWRVATKRRTAQCWHVSLLEQSYQWRFWATCNNACMLLINSSFILLSSFSNSSSIFVQHRASGYADTFVSLTLVESSSETSVVQSLDIPAWQGLTTVQLVSFSGDSQLQCPISTFVELSIHSTVAHLCDYVLAQDGF